MAVKTDMQRTIRISLVCVWILLILTPSAALANYWDDFKKARDAVEAKNWQEAEKLLRSAIADEPTAKRRPLGARYTPYYLLGIVLQERGDCRGALEAWKTSEKSGIVKPNSDESRDRAKRKTRCEQAVTDARQAKEEVDQIVQRGRATLDSVDSLSRQAALAKTWTTGSPSFAGRRQEAADLLDRAAKKSQQGNQSLDMNLLTSARREADQAAKALEKLASDAESLLGEAHAARGAAARELDAARQKAEQAISSISDLEPFPPRLNRGVQDLRRKLSQSEAKRQEAGLEELKRLTSGLKKSTRTVRSRARRPPQALTEAAQAFLNHEFQMALEVLEAAEFKRDRARYHASLLQAACYHGMFVAGGMTDPSLRDAAEEQILLAESLNEEGKMGSPGDRFFSPAFRSLWQLTVDSAATAESEEGQDTDGGLTEPTSEDSN